MAFKIVLLLALAGCLWSPRGWASDDALLLEPVEVFSVDSFSAEGNVRLWHVAESLRDSVVDPKNACRDGVGADYILTRGDDCGSETRPAVLGHVCVGTPSCYDVGPKDVASCGAVVDQQIWLMMLSPLTCDTVNLFAFSFDVPQDGDEGVLRLGDEIPWENAPWPPDGIGAVYSPDALVERMDCFASGGDVVLVGRQKQSERVAFVVSFDTKAEPSEPAWSTFEVPKVPVSDRNAPALPKWIEDLLDKNQD